MNLIGDIERFIATNLYPNRVPIAIALGILAVVAVIVARRRGWFAAARRHPGRTGALVVLALALGVPSGWYLGSPLFIRTSLDEPAPGSSTPTAAPAPSGAAASATPDADPGATPGSDLATPRSGTFTGADEFHFGSGTATLIETAPGAWTVRFENFSVRNGPDLYVLVSPDPAGYTVAAIELGRLKATDGNFNMDLPAGSDPAAAASVVIWCKQFAVQFAVAPLEG
ncbi:MAG: DM13 domain-containing protein [Chloroflexota bacterium]